MARRREIRNSTAEFLIFQAEAKEKGGEVYYKDENIWATQKAMATLFDVNVPAISKHLKNIFESGELKDNSVVSKIEITASDDKHYQTQFYSLDAIIAMGYRVNYGHDSNAPLIEKIKEYLSKNAEGSLNLDRLVGNKGWKTPAIFCEH